MFPRTPTVGPFFEDLQRFGRLYSLGPGLNILRGSCRRRSERYLSDRNMGEVAHVWLCCPCQVRGGMIAMGCKPYLGCMQIHKGEADDAS